MLATPQPPTPSPTPAPKSTPTIWRRFVAVWRLLAVLWHLLVGAWTIKFIFPRLGAAQRHARIQLWSQTMLRRLGIRLVQRAGVAQPGPVLLVSNHISWLDIAVLHASCHCRFISKSDIARWPVVGLLATGAGTLYIERSSRRDALRVVHQMAACLQAGDVLAVFPEGTTGDGVNVLAFHANLLQAALTVQAPIQPVALCFTDGTGQTSLAPCYVGDDTLLQSLWRTVCSHGLCAEVQFGQAQTDQGRDRRRWASDLRAAIVAMRQTPP